MDPNTCSSHGHLTGTYHFFREECSLICCSGIAAHGYHHVNYFDGPKRQEHDYFYGKALQVMDVNVLSFASHVQALPVDYIHNRLVQPRAAELFCEWWTRPRGRWTLAHAGHAGSNNTMGVEVDWRDMKRLVPP
jgi:hypothetical protein